ncbi:hypothetical protein JXB02_00745 [Candidatus Woesearchaeota archaeon]|nr:hypothetical protein [Candidatus Woesearchaeota archaeon]
MSAEIVIGRVKKVLDNPPWVAFEIDRHGFSLTNSDMYVKSHYFVRRLQKAIDRHHHASLAAKIILKQHRQSFHDLKGLMLKIEFSDHEHVEIVPSPRRVLVRLGRVITFGAGTHLCGFHVRAKGSFGSRRIWIRSLVFAGKLKDLCRQHDPTRLKGEYLSFVFYKHL